MRKVSILYFYICLFIISYILINGISIYADDAVNIKLTGSLIDRIIYRYKVWDTRIVSQIFMYELTIQNLIIFKIIFSLFNVLFVYSLCKICKLNLSIDFLIYGSSLVFLFPFEIMKSAGWIATFTNYYFPSVCCIASLSIYIDVFDNKINKIQYFFSILLFLYATDNEQTAIASLLILLFILYFFVKNKKNIKFILIQLFICLCMLAKVLLSPGMTNRKRIEIINWFPDFISFNFFDKIYICFNSTMTYLYEYTNILFLLFGILLFINIYKKNNSTAIRLVSFFPFISTLLYNLKLNDLMPSNFSNGSLTNLFYGITPYSIFDIKIYIIQIVFILNFVSIIFSLYLIFYNTKYKLYPVILFIIVFSTRMVMAFSPTIFASGTRTWCVLFFGIILLCALLLKQINDKFLYTTVSMLGVVCIILNVYIIN